jgi:hypothetical protein
MTVAGAMGGKSQAPADCCMHQPRPGPVWGVFRQAEAGDGRMRVQIIAFRKLSRLR